MTVAAGQHRQIHRRGMQMRGCLVESEIGEQLVRHTLGCIECRRGQYLVEVGHGRQQASRIGKPPVPSAVLWEGECQAASLPVAVSPLPEDDTTVAVGL